MQSKLRQKQSELRQLVSNLENMKKSNLTDEQRKMLEGRIKVAKILARKPKTPIHWDQHGDIQIGKLTSPRCLYCNDSLDKFRTPSVSFKIDPKFIKNVEKYCSKSCMVQHSKMNKKRKELGADLIMWGKDKLEFTYLLEYKNCQVKKPHQPITISLPTRKTRSKNYKELG